MKRRNFLKGILGTAAIVAAPSLVAKVNIPMNQDFKGIDTYRNNIIEKEIGKIESWNISDVLKVTNLEKDTTVKFICNADASCFESHSISGEDVFYPYTKSLYGKTVDVVILNPELYFLSYSITLYSGSVLLYSFKKIDRVF